MDQVFKVLANRVRKNEKPEKCEIVGAYVNPDWCAQWCELFWADDVNTEIAKACQWTHEIAESDQPGRLPSRRGLRAFLGRWIRRDCRLKPQVRMIKREIESKPEVPRETVSNHLNKMKEALRVK